jgi:hypothetical protein
MVNTGAAKTKVDRDDYRAFHQDLVLAYEALDNEYAVYTLNVRGTFTYQMTRLDTDRVPCTDQRARKHLEAEAHGSEPDTS